MYFPYLRGKQFELIAIRELCERYPENLNNISPVIEPVKASSTLRSTLFELCKANVNFTIIINPRVGDLQQNVSKILEILAETIKDYQNFQLGIIVDVKTKNNITDMLKFLKEINLTHNGFTLIHNVELGDNYLNTLKEELNITYNLVNFDKVSRRYYRLFDPATLVSLDDYFVDQQKNADYLDVESFFSDEYRFYRTDGYVGFSDYLTIGDNYTEAGFLPRAVAIHISYLDENGQIKVKHFVSDSNGDTSDIGGKFAEAVRKLVEWSNETGFETEAIKVLKELDQDGHFPGLGTLKKLAVLNHIELMIRLLP